MVEDCIRQDAQLIFLIFNTFACNFFSSERVSQIYRQMYGKLEKWTKPSRQDGAENRDKVY